MIRLRLVALFSFITLLSVAFGPPEALGQDAPFITVWDTQINGETGNDQIKIPGSGTDYTIEWEEVGNPTNDSSGTGTGTHTVTFPRPGTYRVKISGNFTRINFESAEGGDRNKIVRVEQWGDIVWETMARAFGRARNVEISADDTPDFSNVTSTRRMFRDAESVTGENSNMESWDTSNITNMARMFEQAESFDHDISSWDVSSVTNMGDMFRFATSFNQNIGEWDVSNVTDMARMFFRAYSFNGDISSWNTGSAINVNQMFKDAESFNQDIGEWDVSNVSNMDEMFRNASNFNQNLGEWDVSGVEDTETFPNSFKDMFSGTALSPENYDRTLIGWAGRRINSGLELGASGVKYCDSGPFRDHLAQAFNLSIEDSGQKDGCPEILAASDFQEVDSDGTYDFSDVATSVTFSGLIGSGRVTIGRLGDDPRNVEGIDEARISPYRLVIVKGTISFFESAEFRFDTEEFQNVGLPETITVYTRSQPGSGTFTPLTTTFDESTGELVATTDSLGEIVFASPNNPPTAKADTFQTPEDEPLIEDAPGVLANDADPNGDTLSASAISDVSNGSLTLSEDGSLEYVPNEDFNGTDGFTYRIEDESGVADTASVTIHISPINDPPVAAADSFMTQEDSALVVEPPGVLGNDSDVDDTSLSASLVAGPENGSLTFDSDGSFEYVPAPDFNGEDSFMYEAVDDSSAADTASVTIAILPINDPPVANADSFETTQDSTLTVAAPGVLANDTDVDGDTLAATLVSSVSNGSLTLQEDGSFGYVPASGFSGEDSFAYKAVDDSSAADTASAYITVRPPPPPPENLTASVEGEEVSLEWTAPAAEDIAQYRLYRDTEPIDSTETPPAMSPLDSTAAGETTYRDTSVVPGQTYYYRATAVDNGAVESAVSGEATATPEDRTPPPVPAGLTADPGDQRVLLSWNTVDAEDLTGYRLYRAVGEPPDTSDAPLTQDLVSETSFTDTSTTENQTYRYGVTAVDTAGNESPLSQEASAFLYPDQIQAEITRSFGEASGPGDYRLVALPGQADRPLADVINGEAGSQWQAYYDDGSAEDYFQKYDGSEVFTLEAGTGFWLTATSNWAFEDSISTVALQGDSAAKIALREGWNVISNPTDKPVQWSRVEAANGGGLQPLWEFEGAFGEAETFESAVSGKAYYFFNETSSRTELLIPYPGAPSGSLGLQNQRASTGADPAKEPSLLSLSATLAEGSGPVSTVQIGIQAQEPRMTVAPPAEFESVSLRLKTQEGEPPADRSAFLMTERREKGGEGETFHLRLLNKSDRPVELTASRFGAVGQQNVALLHPSAGKTHRLRPDKSVRIDRSEEKTSLELAVGSEEYVDEKVNEVIPDEVTLSSYPNPARQQATLSYALTEATEVSLEVYDLLGRRVATLARGRKEAGRHSKKLDVSDLSSGVYFGRLEVGGEIRTQKITVVR